MAVTDVESYCRQLEAYLCRKNDGHLIRIVGPTFEQVCGWAARGVPIKVAEETIGGVGVSGAPGGPNDKACAVAGIERVADRLK